MKVTIKVFLKQKCSFVIIFVLCAMLGYWMTYAAGVAYVPSWLRSNANNDDVKRELSRTNGANVDARDWMGQTGLMVAIASYDIERFHLLLSYGADVNARSSQSPREEDITFNNTPLHYAVKYIYAHLFTNNVAISDELIDEGADVNAQNSNGETPLMWAVMISRLDDRQEIVKMLISDMADVNLQDNIGNTCFMTAISSTDRGWLQYFMDTYGSMLDFNLRNRDGLDTLGVAKKNVHERYIDIVQNRKLIGFGDNVRERDIIGRTGLMLAIIRNDYPFAERQIQYNADIEAVDATRFANRALHFALMRRTNIGPFIKLLVDNGAKVNVQSRYGDTPLHYLVRYNFGSFERDAAAEQMIAAGADPSIRNNKGRSVIDEARRKDPSFAQLLTTLTKKYRENKK